MAVRGRPEARVLRVRQAPNPRDPVTEAEAYIRQRIPWWDEVLDRLAEYMRPGGKVVMSISAPPAHGVAEVTVETVPAPKRSKFGNKKPLTAA